jgi:hypothetical protein
MFPELITELLQDGYKVNFSAPGHSMYPTIMANETIMVEPIDPGTVRLGDIILYRTNGRVIAHRVIHIEKRPDGLMRTPPSSEQALLPTFIKGAIPILKDSAPQTQCSSNEVPHHRSAAPRPKQRDFTSDFRSEGVQQAQRSSSEALHFIFRGDAAQFCDQPVKGNQILGKVISIERNGCSIDPYSFRHKIACLTLTWKSRVKRLLN